ncbi:hypothetical protein [Streptomyces sp. MJP52]|uniref:Rv1733c family protein n=1 Tax=Streptomyces sp. MJP52 TaxID=2940555 RepID=UPI002476E69D|nr:hypothetical protein [Streptomyces sp. MJP52]MDH6229012.1 hypothetical protein [Streptomyces sp. MJP52]
MGSRRRTRTWRWRNNPLRRREDLLEAWTVVIVWAVMALGGVAVGAATAHAAAGLFAGQRAERHAVGAVLLGDVPGTSAGTGSSRDRVAARVRWTDHDGTVRTVRTWVVAGAKTGERVVIWTDGRGAVVAEPPDRTDAAVEAGLLAVGSAFAFAGLVHGAGAVVRWRLDRRRFDRWDREGELAGPLWGHRTG